MRNYWWHVARGPPSLGVLLPLAVAMLIVGFVESNSSALKLFQPRKTCPAYQPVEMPLLEWTACPVHCICSSEDVQLSCHGPNLPDLSDAGAVDLRWMVVQGVGIHRLQAKHFHGFNNLQFLALTNGRISEIDEDAFMDLLLLIHLDLSNNQIFAIPVDAFTHNRNLLSLNLGGNPLYVPSSGPLLLSGSLQKLILRGCSISSVNSQTFTGVPLLSEIFMEDNPLTDFPSEAISGLKWLCAIRVNELIKIATVGPIDTNIEEDHPGNTSLNTMLTDDEVTNAGATGPIDTNIEEDHPGNTSLNTLLTDDEVTNAGATGPTDTGRIDINIEEDHPGNISINTMLTDDEVTKAGATGPTDTGPIDTNIEEDHPGNVSINTMLTDDEVTKAGATGPTDTSPIDTNIEEDHPGNISINIMLTDDEVTKAGATGPTDTGPIDTNIEEDHPGNISVNIMLTDDEVTKAGATGPTDTGPIDTNIEEDHPGNISVNTMLTDDEVTKTGATGPTNTGPIDTNVEEDHPGNIGINTMLTDDEVTKTGATGPTDNNSDEGSPFIINVIMHFCDNEVALIAVLIILLIVLLIMLIILTTRVCHYRRNGTQSERERRHSPSEHRSSSELIETPGPPNEELENRKMVNGRRDGYQILSQSDKDPQEHGYPGYVYNVVDFSRERYSYTGNRVLDVPDSNYGLPVDWLPPRNESVSTSTTDLCTSVILDVNARTVNFNNDI